MVRGNFVHSELVSVIFAGRDLSLRSRNKRRSWRHKQGQDQEATIVRDLQLMTCEEVAQLLRVSPETVRQLAAAGELPGRKIGRAWRFPRTAIEAIFLGGPNHASGSLEMPASQTGTEGATVT